MHFRWGERVGIVQTGDARRGEGKNTASGNQCKQVQLPKTR